MTMNDKDKCKQNDEWYRIITIIWVDDRDICISNDNDKQQQRDQAIRNNKNKNHMI